MTVQELLTGVRIIDLAGESAAFAARLLADLGAEVIRVEPPEGDPLRKRPGFIGGKAGPDRSTHHQHYNRNKRSVVLDLDDRAGLETYIQLCATADAVIETVAPGSMDAIGAGFEALRASNPGLVYTTVTPFGQQGPFRDYRGNDLIGAASSGLLYLNGFPDDPPNVPGGEQAYKMASLVAASSTLMALVGRQHDGHGRRVDVSLQEAASMTTTQTGNANIYTWHGRIPRRAGNTSGLQKSRDGKWVSFTLRVGSQETWGDLAQWLKDEQIDTPVTADEYRDQSYRFQHRPLVTAAIAALCARHDRMTLFHEGQRRKQLVMPVNDVDALLDDEQMHHREFFAKVDHPELGLSFVDSGSPYRLTPVVRRPSTRAPLLGEHTREVVAALEGAPPRPAPAPAREFDPVRPLEGIRVADFTWMIAGPATSRMLADFGAEVIKIESEYRTDNIRVVGVQPSEPGSLDTNGVFNDQNTNKISVKLNVNQPRGLELAKEIIKRSDLVLNNYTAERMPKWGLSYEELKELKPDIISMSMPVMGTTGPYRNYGSYGNGVIAFGGLNSITGFESRPPVGLGPLYSDFAGPYMVVTALMAALHRRNETGEGCFIDFSQAEGTSALLGPAFIEYTANGDLPRRNGNRSPEASPHGVFPCEGDDRWCAIAVYTDAEWAALCDAMDRPELATDTRFATLEARKANEDELEALVGGWTAGQEAWALMHRLQGRGIMASVVADLEDMCVRDPWLSTQHLVDVPFEEEGITFRTHQQPVRFDGQLPPLRRAPRFGEHSQEVLEALLGITGDEFTELMIEQVVF